MRVRWLMRLGLAVGALAVGCAPADRAEPGESTRAEEAATPAPAAATTPGADAAALWSHLTSTDYGAQWALWPGKGRNYPGGEPHGATLTTYVNRAAADALAAGAPRMPAGAIIVKENYMPDGSLAAITTMSKIEGYSPAAGDWFWVKYLPDGSVDEAGAAQGRVSMCIQCHSGKADNDYIFTGQLGGG